MTRMRRQVDVHVDKFLKHDRPAALEAYIVQVLYGTVKVL